jgi:hypothetical protein
MVEQGLLQTRHTLLTSRECAQKNFVALAYIPEEH